MAGMTNTVSRVDDASPNSSEIASPWKIGSNRMTLAPIIALESVRNAVRVGQKPTVDLLDAEREALSASSAQVAARGERVVDAYRLIALLDGD